MIAACELASEDPLSFLTLLTPAYTGKILNIPIYCTTQNAARLGATVSEIKDILPPDTKEVDKTAFSMV
jgi:hypothetical protein